MARSQIPLHFEIFGPDGKMNQAWAFWFEQFVQGLAPDGAGFVVDGTGTTWGQATLYQGAQALRSGSPTQGDIYLATDTGNIFVAVGSSWVLQSGPLVGDVLKDSGSLVTNLVEITTPASAGGPTTIPVITIDAKGRVTSLSSTPTGQLAAAGADGSVQLNSNGALGSDPSLFFTSGTLTLGKGLVTDVLSFTTPSLTLNNLLPPQLGLVGQVLTTNGTNAVWSASAGGSVVDYIPPGLTLVIAPRNQYIVVTLMEIAGSIDNAGTLAIL